MRRISENCRGTHTHTHTHKLETLTLVNSCVCVYEYLIVCIPRRTLFVSTCFQEQSRPDLCQCISAINIAINNLDKMLEPTTGGRPIIEATWVNLLFQVQQCSLSQQTSSASVPPWPGSPVKAKTRKRIEGTVRSSSHQCLP